MVLGRVTYQEWAPYWPTVTDGEDAGFADFINSTPKLVASRTLTPARITWRNCELIDGDMIEALSRLKEGEGGDIAIQGSLSVVRQCLEAGLMDELTLIIHPVVAAKGRGLFDTMATTRLELLSARATRKGNIVATYGPRRELN
ncbi:dihydrofolate reductase family protein [Schaalia sp. 19OD2882]|uniref:dihydrofolate reductase family protein n=1 Tax=Schaalia sp. 19OD2882 TaxID=2794089 RepID=UPI001C1ECE58|nr:dihydrofolate reductase family protein [Schaalia sp. 19OD2882]QWW19308.1 dihydrofolate reductase family protein [Schaalia sp. 19OD2882]